MTVSKNASVYSILVGISMIGLWMMLLSTGQVPELASEPYRIMAHILTEIATGLLLAIGGWALITRRAWGTRLFIFSQGALFYSLIASPGYYIQLGTMPMVIMFVVLLVLNVAILGLLLKRPQEFATQQ
ncbi:MAG: hypothetical protein ACE5H4_13245 [Candidatus Thorarchaeota archaeon]